MLLGSKAIFFQGFVEINAVFSGIKGAQTPLGASCLVLVFVMHYKVSFLILQSS